MGILIRMRIPISLGLVAAALACSAPTDQLGCQTSADCDLGLICDDGQCRGGDGAYDGGRPLDAGPNPDPLDATVRPDGGGPGPYDGGPPTPRPDGGTPGHPFPPTGPIECMPPAPVLCTCASGQNGLQQCRSDGTLGACYCSPGDRREDLERVRLGIVGSWVGQRTTPWDGTHLAWFRFEASGRYYALCDDCSTLYWGEDTNVSQRRYDIFDTYADGGGEGEIALMFGSGAQMTPIQRIDISEDENHVTFEVWRRDVRFPVEVELTRVPR